MTEEPLSCFIIMPISTPADRLDQYQGDKQHFSHVVDHLFEPALKDAGFRAIRPNAEGSDIIHGEIVKNLNDSDLVLCDMSTLNPNVFFELGIRCALDKPICMVRDQNTDKVPFDAGVINFHTYDSSLSPWLLEEQQVELANHIVKSHERSQRSNTLWKYFGLAAVGQLAAPEEGEASAIQILSERIELLTRHLDDRSDSSKGDLARFIASLNKALGRKIHSYSYDEPRNLVHVTAPGRPPSAGVGFLIERAASSSGFHVNIDYLDEETTDG